MWGQVKFLVCILAMLRIIPTRVGTSTDTKYEHISERDHPHACGDKTVKKECQAPEIGSSPRVWGQVSESSEPPQFFRIIPTRVGTSNFVIVDCSSCTDHPHACGDKQKLRFTYNVSEGSSPRVWGQATFVIGMKKSPRIIPTRVGTRKEKRKKERTDKDHPHACGDKFSYEL